jgi:ferredoxin
MDTWAGRDISVLSLILIEISSGPGEGLIMPWVITRLCIDCLDTGCVSVCPVDCIYEYVGDDRVHFPNQLYINPDECIDCGACEPECPWQAIYEEPAVPDVFKTDVELNRKTIELQDQFRVGAFEDKPRPTPEQVATNKIEWGLNSNA